MSRTLALRCLLTPLLVLSLLTVTLPGRPSLARAQGPEALLAIVGYVQQGWNAYKQIDSLIHGPDPSIASQINAAREAILQQIRGIVETQLLDDVEASIRNWSEISVTLQQSPSASNPVMVNRIPDLLNSTQRSWVALRNMVNNTTDQEVVYRLMPAFDTISMLRVTILKALGQLDPPQPVPFEVTYGIMFDTAALDYRVVGAGSVLVFMPDFTVFPAFNTVRDKRLYRKFFAGATYTCGHTCENYVGNLCVGLHLCERREAVLTCTGTGDGRAQDCVSCGNPHPNCQGWICDNGIVTTGPIQIWLPTEYPECAGIRDAAVFARMIQDPTVALVRASLAGISQAEFVPVYDDVYFPGNFGVFLQ